MRTAIFLGYLTLLSRIRDLRRVFEYHGAEHKVISCFEAGDELTPARAKLYSRLHPRCGTSFLLIVMIMAIFVFAPIGLPAWWILVLTRIVGVPLIAGLSFEVIRWAGRNRRRRWVQAIMYPGLQLQKLTTREPDLDELAVSIAALQAVLAVETPGRGVGGRPARRRGRGLGPGTAVFCALRGRVASISDGLYTERTGMSDGTRRQCQGQGQAGGRRPDRQREPQERGQGRPATGSVKDKIGDAADKVKDAVNPKD